MINFRNTLTRQAVVPHKLRLFLGLGLGLGFSSGQSQCVIHRSVP